MTTTCADCADVLDATATTCPRCGLPVDMAAHLAAAEATKAAEAAWYDRRATPAYRQARRARYARANPPRDWRPGPA